MLKETALINEHRRLGAKFINFHGWKLPLEFSGSTAEHLNVRKHSGLFDVSQMGEIRVRGKSALRFLGKYLTNNVSALKENQTQYNLLCNKQGGIIDDLILYCLKQGEDYLLCVNSARLTADLAWLKQADLSQQEVEVCDESAEWTQMALQGPNAQALLTDVLNNSHTTDENSHSIKEPYSTSKLHSIKEPQFIKGDCGKALKEMKKNHFQWFLFFGEAILVSATGYTGEKGFEILICNEKAVGLWRTILECGKNRSCLPAGLAARDTLRMEMKYPLYGKDLNENTDPYSAGLSWAVRNPTNFIGAEALSKIKKNSRRKKWVGFQLLSANEGVPRPGSRILVNETPVGEVTSGAKSPSLGKMIGLGYVPIEYSRPAQRIQVEIHQNPVWAEIIATPFYTPFCKTVKSENFKSNPLAKL